MNYTYNKGLNKDLSDLDLFEKIHIISFHVEC